MTQKFAEITNGSTHKTIYQPIAAGLEICVPPLAEQDAISAKLKTSMSAIDLVRSKVADSVDRLSEYRSALITAAVTGQIEGLQ
jgi:type I restriction enzyme S subunit